MTPNFDIDLLRAFLAVTETGSFTAAARRLNRTQSAVSMQIKRLEALVDGALLERTAQKTALTPQGERLLGFARRLVALNDEAIGQLRDERVAGHVRLGVIEDYAVHSLPPVLGGFAAAHPGVVIEVETGFSPDLLKSLGGKYDLVLALHPDGSQRGQVIRRDRAIWIGSRQHEVYRQPVLPLALHPAGCQFRKVALDALDRCQRPWRLAYISQSLGAIEAAALAGIAVTIGKSGTLPRGLAVLDGADGLPPLAHFEISLHRAPGGIDRAAAALADHIASSLRDGSC